MVTQPLFSIVVPTHNRAQWLARAIHSCLAQTCSDFELIVVDDGSTDNTPKLISTFTDPRIIYLRLPTAHGVSHARNQGILQAKGDYVAFLDDDDAYLADYLQVMQHHLQTSLITPMFSWCGIKKIVLAKDGSEQHIELPGANSATSAALHNLKFATGFSASHGFIVQREVLLAVGLFDATMTTSEDLDLLFRLLQQNYPFSIVPDRLIKVYIHHGTSLSRSRNYAKFAINSQRLVDKHLLFLKRYPLLYRHYLGTLAGYYYRTQQANKARAILWQLLRKFPLHFSSWEKLLRFEVLKRCKRNQVE